MGEKEKRTFKKYKVSITENPSRNIDEITGYIAFLKKEPLNAARIGDIFFSVLERIELNPFAFKECPELKTKSRIYRQAKCSSWIIIYKTNLQHVLILGILHAARKPGEKKLLKKAT